MQHNVVSHQAWLDARKNLLAAEKAFTRERDRISQQRRDLPWEQVTTEYVFDGPRGPRSLSDLFDGRSQLVVYHFMFAPNWDEGCQSCSFWADNFNPIGVHLNHRDVTMVAISRAPYEKLAAYEGRMGWSFPWFSSNRNTFNYDYFVSYRDQDLAKGRVVYNYADVDFDPDDTDMPGISVFYRDDTGRIFHTYSTYGRGIDMMNTAYNYLDLVPKGRDEDGGGMSQWLRRHDEYDSQPAAQDAARAR
jgi:predicted dithiol-disulfide oxidoreductase (DUF899 family)